MAVTDDGKKAACTPRVGNIKKVLLRLRKHSGNVSTVSRDQQTQNSVRLVCKYLKCVLPKSVHAALVPSVISKLNKPHLTETMEEINTLWAVVTLLEQHVNDIAEQHKEAVTADDVKCVRTDCTNRMGELATYALRTDPIRGSVLFSQYLSRRS